MLSVGHAVCHAMPCKEIYTALRVRNPNSISAFDRSNERSNERSCPDEDRSLDRHRIAYCCDSASQHAGSTMDDSTASDAGIAFRWRMMHQGESTGSPVQIGIQIDPLEQTELNGG